MRQHHLAEVGHSVLRRRGAVEVGIEAGKEHLQARQPVDDEVAEHLGLRFARQSGVQQACHGEQQAVVRLLQVPLHIVLYLQVLPERHAMQFRVHSLYTPPPLRALGDGRRFVDEVQGHRAEDDITPRERKKPAALAHNEAVALGAHHAQPGKAQEGIDFHAVGRNALGQLPQDKEQLRLGQFVPRSGHADFEFIRRKNRGRSFHSRRA